MLTWYFTKMLMMSLETRKTHAQKKSLSLIEIEIQKYLNVLILSEVAYRYATYALQTTSTFKTLQLSKKIRIFCFLQNISLSTVTSRYVHNFISKL